MFGEISATDVLKNARVKIYPDGNTKALVCRTPIFKNSSFEEQKKVDKDVVKYLLGQSRAKRKIKQLNDIGYSLDDWAASPKAEKPVIPQSSEPRYDNLKRAREHIFDIIYCNHWDYFVTITFNPEQIDSYNPHEVMSVLRSWLANSVSRKGLRYILIPEYHKSGRIHAHALINDVFKLVDSGLKAGDKTVYNITNWRYGFSTAIPCDNSSRLASYVTKYVTKDSKKIFGRFYLSSKNIVRSPALDYIDMDFDSIDSKEYNGFKYVDSFKPDSDYSDFDEMESLLYDF